MGFEERQRGHREFQGERREEGLECGLEEWGCGCWWGGWVGDLESRGRWGVGL